MASEAVEKCCCNGQLTTVGKCGRVKEEIPLPEFPRARGAATWSRRRYLATRCPPALIHSDEFSSIAPLGRHGGVYAQARR